LLLQKITKIKNTALKRVFYLFLGQVCLYDYEQGIRVQSFVFEKITALGAPTVKQFYIKTQKGRGFLVLFAHDLACKV